MRPDAVFSWTARSLSARTRTVMLPEMVVSRISLRRGLSKSQVIAPETVCARTRSAALSARITSPETVSTVRSPRTPSASTGPEVSFAEVLPRNPIRVIWPATTFTVVCRRRPEATSEPATRPRSAWTSAGTAMETSTRG